MSSANTFWKCAQIVHDHLPVFQPSAGQFAENKGVGQNTVFQQQAFQPQVSAAQMIDPNRSINKDHRLGDRLLRMRVSFGSVPPNSARRRALSLAIRAFRPMRTSAVFSETPVSFAAFLRSWSSIISVERICINMHDQCIPVKCTPSEMTIPQSRGVFVALRGFAPSWWVSQKPHHQGAKTRRFTKNILQPTFTPRD